LPIETHHHDVAQGQPELAMKFGHNVAQANGKAAAFMPKPDLWRQRQWRRTRSNSRCINSA
jgi:glutamine synthetase